MPVRALDAQPWLHAHLEQLLRVARRRLRDRLRRNRQEGLEAIAAPLHLVHATVAGRQQRQQLWGAQLRFFGELLRRARCQRFVLGGLVATCVHV